MILVVGGQGSGKSRYVAEQGFPDSAVARAELDDRPVFADLHLFLRECADIGDDVFETLLRKEIVVCNEIGCGIVPADAADRAWRDRVGRTCARLASRAERVVRMCCGIPLIIKDGQRDGRGGNPS